MRRNPRTLLTPREMAEGALADGPYNQHSQEEVDKLVQDIDDAIKAAVASERERCLGPLREWMDGVEPTGDDNPTCAKCGDGVHVGDGLEWEDGDVCGPCASALFQVVAKLLRDRGADAPGAGK